jgi:ABC-type glycerol-3-phosphate transport system permease component
MLTQMQSLDLLFNKKIDPIGMRMAAGVILLIPNLLIFIFFNKRLIKDLKLGSLTK